MRILLIGGTFDNKYGKESGIIRQMEKIMKDMGLNVYCINGGHTDELKSLANSGRYNIKLWFPNMSNEVEKMEVKKDKVLVVSKHGKTFEDAQTRALMFRANMFVHFTPFEMEDIIIDRKFYRMTVADTLGAEWYYGKDIQKATSAMIRRAMQIANFTRESITNAISSEKDYSVDDELKSLVALNKSICPKDYTPRAMGNIFYRCTKGFPLMRGGECMFFASPRNVPKSTLECNQMVPLVWEQDEYMYVGDVKPSLDTPVQLRLMHLLPKINFMLHGHVLKQNYRNTKNVIPCGCIEEVYDVLMLVNRNAEAFGVNLRGHGYLIGASTLEKLVEVWEIGGASQDTTYHKRSLLDPDEVYKPCYKNGMKISDMNNYYENRKKQP